MGLFCQEVSAEWRIFLPSSASLFDLKARFFVSDPKPSRAGAVKAVRLFGDQPQGLAFNSFEQRLHHRMQSGWVRNPQVDDQS